MAGVSLSEHLWQIDDGFHNPSRKTSNTFASKLERFWPSPPGYAFKKNINMGENRTEHIKGNIGNLNVTSE